MQAPANQPSCLSAPLQSMTAAAAVQTPRSHRKTASDQNRTPHSRDEQYRLLRLLPKKQMATRRGAKPCRSARRTSTHPAEAELVDIATRRTRGSPKQADSRSPRSRVSPRTAIVEFSGHPDINVSDRSHAIITADASTLCTSQTSALWRSSATSGPVPDPSPYHRRGSATCVLSHATEAARVIDPVRPAARTVTAVQAHPSRTTRTSEDGASNPTC
jgi:hypothetical protein